MVTYSQPEVYTFICHRWHAVRYQIVYPLKIKYQISDPKKIKYQISRGRKKSDIWLNKSDIRYQTPKKSDIRYRAP